MIAWMRMMISCHYSASRLDRYLDADPAAQLRQEERGRLAAHLAVCERCSREADRHRLLRASLRRLGEHRRPDTAAVARLEALVRAIAEEHPS